MFLNCSYFLLFPNSKLVTRNIFKNGAKKYVYCFIQHYAKTLETADTASAHVTSLLITLPAPDDPANSNKSLYICTYQTCVQGLNKFLKFV